ncbi:hypothetical protein CE139_19140 [Pseudomonas oryzihabitans]|uniref:Uncharacterized protein n=1 Tax=Pseudomonas oryzihabitans TaxID=47885 RepID=A0A2Z5AD88_9PSED|nr:hypothetical protein CE139_19140 [Pseudomonas oryzihabitans]
MVSVFTSTRHITLEVIHMLSQLGSILKVGLFQYASDLGRLMGNSHDSCLVSRPDNCFDRIGRKHRSE